jgi:hypothetical protein
MYWKGFYYKNSLWQDDTHSHSWLAEQTSFTFVWKVTQFQNAKQAALQLGMNLHMQESIPTDLGEG